MSKPSTNLLKILLAAASLPETHNASGALVAPAPVVSGSGIKIVVASGALVAPLPIVSGSSTFFQQGGDLVAPLPEVDGSAVIIMPASGSMTSPTPIMSGAADLTLPASGSMVAPSGIIDGSAQVIVAASGALVSVVGIVSGTGTNTTGETLEYDPYYDVFVVPSGALKARVIAYTSADFEGEVQLDSFTGDPAIRNIDIDILGTTNVSLITDDITANASAISSLSSTVTSINGVVTANSSAITSINSSIVDLGNDISGNASAISTLETTVTSQGSSISANASAITALSSTVTTQGSTLSATASAVTTLQTNVTVIDGQIVDIHAQWGVTVDVNGRVTGTVQLDADDSHSTFAVNADKFVIYNGSTEEEVFTVTGGEVFINDEKVGTGSIVVDAVSSTDSQTYGTTGSLANGGSLTELFDFTVDAQAADKPQLFVANILIQMSSVDGAATEMLVRVERQETDGTFDKVIIGELLGSGGAIYGTWGTVYESYPGMMSITWVDTPTSTYRRYTVSVGIEDSSAGAALAPSSVCCTGLAR